MNILETLKTYLAHPYAQYVIIAVALIGGLIVACNGKKLLNFFKFLICAGAGFWAGLTYLAPVVLPYVVNYLGSAAQYGAYIVGGVVALVAALLCKLLYPLAFAGAIAYGAYTALLLPEVVALVMAKVPAAAVVLQNPTYVLVAVAVVFVLALILRGLIEMLGTAVAGGYAFAYGLEKLIVTILALAGQVYVSVFTPVTVLLVTGVIALIGFIKQVKNRHRF